MKKALLVIDFINGIVRDGSCSEWCKTHPIVENTNQLIAKAREHNVPIYFIRVAFDKNYSGAPKHSKLFNFVKENHLLQLGSESTEFIDKLDCQAGTDIVINKTGASPFTGNDLETQLNQLDPHLKMGVWYRG